MPLFTPEAIANTVAEVANQLDGIVGTTATQAGASPDLVKQITAGIDGLKQAASALGQAEHSDQAQPIMQRVMADVNAVLAALTMLPLPPPASIVLRIVQVLVPTISAAASIVWPAAVVQVHSAQHAEEDSEPAPDARDDAQPHNSASLVPPHPESVAGASPNTTQNVASSNAPQRRPGGAA